MKVILALYILAVYFLKISGSKSLKKTITAKIVQVIRAMVRCTICIFSILLILVQLLQANILSELSSTSSLHQESELTQDTYPSVSCAVTLMNLYFTHCYSVTVFLHDKSLQGYDYFQDLQEAIGKEKRWPVYVVRYWDNLNLPQTSNCSMVISLNLNNYTHAAYETDKMIVVTAEKQIITRGNLDSMRNYFFDYNVRIVTLFQAEKQNCKVLHDTIDEFRTDSLQPEDYSYLQNQFNNEESSDFVQKNFNFNLFFIHNNDRKSKTFERDTARFLFSLSRYYTGNTKKESFNLAIFTGHDFTARCGFNYKIMYPTFPYMYSPYATYVPIRKPLDQWWGMILIFQNTTWLLIAILFAICVIVWLVLLRLVKEFPRQQNFIHSFITNLCLLLGASSPYRPSNPHLQVFFAVIAIYAMHITTAYLSNWINFLTVPIKTVQIKTLADMEAAGIIKFECPFDICDCDSLLKQHKKDGYPYNVAISCRRLEMILSGEQYSWSEVTDSFQTNYLAYCIFNRIRKREIDRIILLAHSSGLLTKIAKNRRFRYSIKHFSKDTMDNSQVDSNIPQKLSLTHLQGGFFLLIIGLMISFVCFLIEISCKYKSTSIRRLLHI